MANPNAAENGYKQLKQDITAGSPGPLYLFWGEEDYLREHCLSDLKKLILPEGLVEFNYKRFDGKKTELAMLEEAVDTFPVFCKKTLVELRDFDFYKAAADKRDRLLGIIEDLPEYCCMVIVFTDPGFRPDARTKLHTAIKNRGLVVEFQKQRESDLIHWVRRRFAAMEKEIGRSDAEYLIHLAGGLMTNLISEIEKIGAYARGKTVSRQDIDTVAAPVLDAVVFKMTDALSNRDFDGAVKVMGELIQMRESPIMILSVIGKQMRQLHAARLCLENGKGAAHLKELWALRSDYPARLLVSSAKNLPTRWCRNAVILCAETDALMKSTGTDGEILLKELLIKLAAE